MDKKKILYMHLYKYLDMCKWGLWVSKRNNIVHRKTVAEDLVYFLYP